MNYLETCKYIREVYRICVEGGHRDSKLYVERIGVLDREIKRGERA